MPELDENAPGPTPPVYTTPAAAGDGAAPQEPVEDYALDLDLEVGETQKIRLSGDEYELLSLDHLSPEQEAQVTGTFARLQRAFFRLEESDSDAAATKEAAKLRTYREKLIQLMTTIPPSVIRSAGTGKQGRLLEVIRVAISGGDDGGGED